jgi:hypothetical protein
VHVRFYRPIALLLRRSAQAGGQHCSVRRRTCRTPHAYSFETDLLKRFATQMFAPSNATPASSRPRVPHCCAGARSLVRGLNLALRLSSAQCKRRFHARANIRMTIPITIPTDRARLAFAVIRLSSVDGMPIFQLNSKIAKPQGLIRLSRNCTYICGRTMFYLEHYADSAPAIANLPT